LSKRLPDRSCKPTTDNRPLTTNSPIFLAGPTAVGKSEIALQLAERIGGEIISVDSMQVYRGLDIGTAKPSHDEQQRIRHHLIDVADLNESFDAARFVSLAKAAVADVESRGKIPIFCGGTGLYFKGYLEGLGEAPPADPLLRSQLESTPLDQLLEELQQRDPATYEKVDRQNPRRIIRALEVIRLTGKPFSEQRAAWKSSPHPNCFGIQRPSSELIERIHKRVDEMFQAGLVAETESLLKRGLDQNRTAMQAIGYKQAVEHLHGQRSLAETIELVKIRTRQYAKRQLTWFRRQMHLQWLNASEAPLSMISK
jgi:tRNA dimethylallyltransferase